jgi:DNA-binding transcriptional LysR family regulator
MSIRADDLLVLLEVARSGTLSSAAASLGVNHATISRRLDSMERSCEGPVVTRTSRGCHLTRLGLSLLESAEGVERSLRTAQQAASGGPGHQDTLSGLVRMSAPEAFAARFATPAMARLQRHHPDVAVELTTATRPIVRGSGVDVEIGVGDPVSAARLHPTELAPYELGFFAAPSYLARRGTPTDLADLVSHSLVFYVDQLVRVADLALIEDLAGGQAVTFGSTSVFSQLEAARAGAGVALLPKFLARTASELVPVLADQALARLKFVAVLAPMHLRRAAAVTALEYVKAEVDARASELTPAPQPVRADERRADERTATGPGRARHSTR